MPYRPRADRDVERLRAAAFTAQAAAGSAMDRALAQIETAFGEVSAVNGFKLRAERYLRFGPAHPAVRARFGGRAAMLAGRNLDAAIAAVERWWRTERKTFQIASALGYGNRLPLEVLSELRLMLRFMRYKGMRAAFGAIVAAVDDETMAEAAE
jgi:hypothetical protein